MLLVKLDLRLRQGGDQRAQLALGLRFLLDAGFKNGIANAFDALQGDAGPEGQRIDDDRIARHQHRNLARE